ncbi:MAG TPA: hemolysin family protein [Gemmatimonadaceae bacterium]|nr:hemolysin family protein [Gemmatimonadaceae bacterium]
MDPLAWPIIVGLLSINALYVAAEFAAVSVRESRVQQKADRGDRRARRLLPVIRDAHALDRYVAACQIGITFSSIVLGAFGQATLTPALGRAIGLAGLLDPPAALITAAMIVLVTLTSAQLVLGEIVPKSLALQYPTSIALWTEPPMRWSLRLLAWFIAILNGSGTALLKMLGMYEESGHRHIHSPEEIELLIAESRDGGVLEPDEHQRLRQALKLGTRTVDEIMVPRQRISALPESATAGEVVSVCSESPYTRLAVYERTIDKIIGIVHVRDIATRMLEHDRSWTARSIMRPVMIVPQGMTTDTLLGRLREERRQLAIVVDEFGGTAGLVTVGDILDEVLGDVVDERQSAEYAAETLADGRVRLRGDLRVDEAAQWLDPEWEGEAYTLGGRITELLGRLPQQGERILISGVDVEIERVRRHAVELVLVSPAAAGTRRAEKKDPADA